MPTKWEILSLLRRLGALQREVSRVAEKNHERSRGRYVLKNLEHVIEQTAQTLTTTLSRIPLTEPELRQERFDAAAEQLGAIVDLFERSDRLDSARVPFEFLDALGKAASEILEENCEVVVHLASAYNYEIVSLRRLFLDERWGWHGAKTYVPRSNGDATLLLMVFPSYEVASVTLHAAAAHELGHELAYKLEEDIRSVLDPLQTEVVNKYREDGVAMGDPAVANAPMSRSDRYSLLVDDFSKRVDEVVKNWVQEIFGDLLGTHLIGPAFLLALERISIGVSDFDAIDDRHPPLTLRRRIMKAYLRDHLPHVLSDPVWATYLGEEPKVRQARGAIWKAASEICESVVARLVPFVQRIKSPLMDREFHQARLSELESLIDQLVPPSAAFNFSSSDIGSEFWFLLYAAWHYMADEARFAAFANRYRWRPGGETARRAIDSLLLQSLQSLELRSRRYLFATSASAARSVVKKDGPIATQ